MGAAGDICDREAGGTTPFRHSLRQGGWRTGAASAAHVDELSGFGDVTGYVELADRLMPGGIESLDRAGKIPAFGGVCGPLAFAGEKFQRFRIFDDDIHGRTS